MAATDNTDNKVIFAADLGGTHLRAATVDRKGRIHSRFKQNTPQDKDAHAIVDAVVAAVHECQEQDSDAEISAVSLVVPGTVKVEDGAVVLDDGPPAGPVLEREGLGDVAVLVEDAPHDHRAGAHQSSRPGAELSRRVQVAPREADTCLGRFDLRRGDRPDGRPSGAVPADGDRPGGRGVPERVRVDAKGPPDLAVLAPKPLDQLGRPATLLVISTGRMSPPYLVSRSSSSRR